VLLFRRQEWQARDQETQLRVDRSPHAGEECWHSTRRSVWKFCDDHRPLFGCRHLRTFHL